MTFSPSFNNFKDINNNYLPAPRAVVTSVPTSSTAPPEGIDSAGSIVLYNPNPTTSVLYVYCGYTSTSGYIWNTVGAVQPALPGTTLPSPAGNSYPTAGLAPVSQFINLANLATTAYTAAADPGYTTPTYVPTSATSTLTISSVIYLNAQGFITTTPAPSQQLLTNIGVNMFSNTGQLLQSIPFQSFGQASYGNSLSIVAVVPSGSYTGGISLKFNIFFDSTYATSGMGACIGGYINPTTNLVVADSAQYMVTYIGETS